MPARLCNIVRVRHPTSGVLQLTLWLSHAMIQLSFPKYWHTTTAKTSAKATTVNVNHLQCPAEGFKRNRGQRGWWRFPKIKLLLSFDNQPKVRHRCCCCCNFSFNFRYQFTKNFLAIVYVLCLLWPKHHIMDSRCCWSIVIAFVAPKLNGICSFLLFSDLEIVFEFVWEYFEGCHYWWLFCC